MLGGLYPIANLPASGGGNFYIGAFQHRLKRLCFSAFHRPAVVFFAQNMPVENILNTMIFATKAQMNRPQF